MKMKRRRITPGVTSKASLGAIAASYSNDYANAISANLPQIPGLQIEHIPSFLHVLRVTSMFFQTNPSKHPFTISDWEKLTNNEIVDGHCVGDTLYDHENVSNLYKDSMINSSVHENLHDVLINRMESISKKSGLASATALDYEDRKTKFVHTVMAWLDEVKILARQRNRQQSVQGASVPKQEVSSTTRNKGHQQPPGQNGISQSIPYFMFLYLWDLQQQQKRVRVRRSALFLSGLLLSRSKDCRHYLDQETHLADWISNIDTNSTDIDLQNNNLDSSQVPLRPNSNRKLFQQKLLQKEAIALISHLVDKGFGIMYAKLSVAAKGLRLRYIGGFTETSDSTNMMPLGMANWRHMRDFALLHGHKEVRKVAKLVDRANEYLEILVPRIEGFRQHPSASNVLVSENDNLTIYCENEKSLFAHKNQRHASSNDEVNNGDDSNASSEDIIDWEDGFEIESRDTKPADNDQNLHISAVDRTMAVMEKTSGTTLFSGGKLEIDFDQRIHGDYGGIKDDVGTDNQVSNMDNPKKRLEKIVQKLSDKHLVRLSAWLDGLRNADNLCRNDSVSLVSISQEKNNSRLYLIKIISTLKQDVSRIISSASRLNIRAQKTKVVAPTAKILSRKCIQKKNRNQHRFRKINVKFQKN